MIGCWDMAVSEMKIGQKAKVMCPYDLAYGEIGVEGFVPPYATLIFDIELISVISPV